MLDRRAVPVIPTSPDASFQSVAVVQGPAAGRSPGRELDRELGEVGLSKAVVRDGTRGGSRRRVRQRRSLSSGLSAVGEALSQCSAAGEDLWGGWRAC